MLQSEHEAAFKVMKRSSLEKDDEMAALKEQLNEVMKSYKYEQMDRQLNEESHGEVVRELQKMLAVERESRAELEKEVS